MSKEVSFMSIILQPGLSKNRHQRCISVSCNLIFTTDKMRSNTNTNANRSTPTDQHQQGHVPTQANHAIVQVFPKQLCNLDFEFYCFSSALFYNSKNMFFSSMDELLMTTDYRRIYWYWLKLREPPLNLADGLYNCIVSIDTFIPRPACDYSNRKHSKKLTNRQTDKRINKQTKEQTNR